MGTSHTCCTTREGLVFSWGYGGDGRLGHGDEHDRLTPTRIESLRSQEVTEVICGELHTAAIVDRNLYTWGLGRNGRLGLGSKTSVLTPTQVEALSGSKILQVACGGLHTVYFYFESLF